MSFLFLGFSSFSVFSTSTSSISVRATSAAFRPRRFSIFRPHTATSRVDNREILATLREGSTAAERLHVVAQSAPIVSLSEMAVKEWRIRETEGWSHSHECQSPSQQVLWILQVGIKIVFFFCKLATAYLPLAKNVLQTEIAAISTPSSVSF